MNNFRVISKEFKNQLRNGMTFSLNTTEFTDRLQGNVGEILELTEQIEVYTIANKDSNVDMKFIDNTSTASLVAPMLNWDEIEGFYKGAAVTFTFPGKTATGTVELITGSTNQELVIDSAGRTSLLAAGLIDGACRDDIIITITTRPDFLNYKYGINPNKSTRPNYKSPLDDNEQSYNLRGITGSYQTMVWTGTEIGSSMGTVEVKFDSTDVYKHTFTVRHTFKIPFYKEGELDNMKNVRNPTDLQSDNTLKYGNGFFFGGSKNNITMTFEDIGKNGNVGYFDSNFSGVNTNYTIKDYAVSNTLGTGKIEATLSNTITFTMESAVGGGFTGGETLILTHAKLPTSEESARNRTAFDDTWLFENIRQVEGAGAVAGTIITNFTVTRNVQELDFSLDVSYTAAQQLLLNDKTPVSVFVNMATQDLGNPDIQDRTQVLGDVNETSEDTDLKNIASLWSTLIYEQWDAVTKTKGFTNFDGYDGDLMYQEFSLSTDITQNAIITGGRFCIVLDNGTDIYTLKCINIPINKIATLNVGGGTYQATSVSTSLNYNLPTSSVLNKIVLQSVIPGSYSATQQWTGSVGFNIPWRSWIENLDIPTSFIDYTEPNDNRNEKTSNYSGVGGYTIKTMLELDIEGDTTQTSSGRVNTVCRFFSDSSAILDFDDTTATTFTASTKIYDYLNVVSQDIPSNIDGRIEIEFAHALGVIILADIEGYIKIEVKDSNIEPWFLGVNMDFTNPLNPLSPSDTLVSGNTTLVEVVSVNNLVTFICNSNAANLTDELTYNIYGRISNRI